MSIEIQVFIDRISKWINKKVNKYISMMIKYTENYRKTSKVNCMKELNEYTKQNKKMYCKNTSQKIAVVTIRSFTCDSPHINSSHAFTMLLTSELCNTLVIQRDCIIVIVAFNAGIEAGSINYLPYIVLHARLYTIARRWIYIKRYTDPHCRGTSGLTVDRIKHNS